MGSNYWRKICWQFWLFLCFRKWFWQKRWLEKFVFTVFKKATFKKYLISYLVPKRNFCKIFLYIHFKKKVDDKCNFFGWQSFLKNSQSSARAFKTFKLIRIIEKVKCLLLIPSRSLRLILHGEGPAINWNYIAKSWWGKNFAIQEHVNIQFFPIFSTISFFFSFFF